MYKKPEQLLLEQIDLLERSISLAENSKFSGGVTIVDEQGNVVEHITFNHDTTKLKQKLAETQKRLASIR